jgi:hypothetical protein
MSNSRTKTMAVMIAVLLTISIAVPIFAQTASAQRTLLTYPLIEALPNPVGVGQKTLINFGLLNYLNTAADGWNITVAITKPDNTTEILGGGPLMTWSTGNAGWYYTPTQVGTYYLQTSFDQTTYRNAIYLASQTDKLALIVQNEPVPTYPSQPLPSEYWVRPIDDQLRSWYTLAGSWVTNPDNLFTPYNQGPESAHILWARPVGGEQGGLIGGVYAGSGEHGFGIGDAYEGKWTTRLIVGGILYYNKYQVQATGGNQKLVAINLRTGQVLWEKLLFGQLPSFGQILYWDSRNNRGAFSYLVVQTGGGFGASAAPTSWAFFEPLTGEWVFNMTNIPSGTVYRDDIGSLVKYTISGGRLLQWNASYAVIAGRTGMSESWGSAVTGQNINVTNRRNGGYDINVSVPTGLPGSIQTVFVGDRIIGGSISQTQVSLWGLDLTPGNQGALLFNTTWATPAEWVQANITFSGFQGGWCALSKESKVGVIWTKENRVHYGFSLETGKYLWKTTPQPFQDAWSGAGNEENHIAYGKLYSAAIAGTVFCYDIKNGSLLWTYNATDPYHESYISNNWWIRAVCITDGKIYLGTTEHSPLNPLPRGAPFFCLNATTGELIWRADGLFRQTAWGGSAIMGDSVIATMDTYDQRVYAIGKGPSTMTVTAPDTAASFATPVIVKGTVMDVSPGTQDEAIKLRFPNGVPAVSDASMSDWMLYVYKQFSMPTNVNGVAVSIDAMDPNNNYVHLGDATTDASGTFNVAITPEVPGYYTVYVTFAGSAAYYASYAETSLYVMPAHAATPAPTPTPVPISEAYFIPAVIGIVITLFIVGAILALLLIRKRA